MPPFPAPQAYLLFALCLARVARATPQVAFPINSQLPLVAYFSQPYDWSFSPNTFSSSLGQLTYALADQPSWLSIDNASRRLSGTPTSEDIDAPRFQIVASSVDGQVFSDVTLVVSKEKTLGLGNGQISSQLASTGNVSAPATLLLHPNQYFNFTASSDCFSGISNKTNYYAVSSNGTPLPSWVSFDSTSLHFSGIAPLLLARNPSKQSFSFKLVASDIIGFSEVNVQFEIVISDRILAFAKPFLDINATRKAYIQIPSLLDELLIERSVVRRDQLTSVRANTPAWLNFNGNDLSFNGTVPENATNSNFSLEVDSSGTNTAKMSIILQLHNGTNTLPSVATTSGPTTPTHSLITESPIRDDTLSGRRLTALILAIVLPILAVIFLVFVIFAWLRKRKKQEKKPLPETTSEHISRPPMHRTESEIGDELSMPGSVVQYESTPHATSTVPQIDLSWAPDSIKRTRRRLSKKPRSRSSTIGSSWDDLVDIRAQAKDSIPPMPISIVTGETRKDSDATIILRPPAQRIPPRRPRRPDSPVREHPSTISHVPKSPKIRNASTKQVAESSHRLSAAGHGAGGNQHPAFANSRTSWQKTPGTLPAPVSQNALDTMTSTQTSSPQRVAGNMLNTRLVESRSNGSSSSPAKRDSVLRSCNNVHNSGQHTSRLRSASGALLTPIQANKDKDALPQMSERHDGVVTQKDKIGHRTPPLPRKSAARSGRSPSPSLTSMDGDRRMQRGIQRVTSAASSHQFDSAVSSDSQWEDENVVLDESTVGETYQQYKAESSGRTPSVRLPFEPYGGSGSATRRIHIADQRRQVNFEHSGMAREEQSHKGSFRFI